MFCSNCGSSLPDGTKFCPECGAAQDQKNSNSSSYSYQPVEYSSTRSSQPEKNAKKPKKKSGCLKGFLIALAIIIVFLIIIGTAGKKDDSTNASSGKNESETVSSSNMEEKAEKSIDKSEKGASSVKPTYVLSDEVLVDDTNVTFKILAAEDDSFLGFTLKAYCENKSADKTMMFSITEASINGYMVNSLWAEEVAAGKKTNSKIYFSNLKESGITSPDEIVFTLRVYDSNDWSADDFIEEQLTIYPTGLSADQIIVPERKSTPKETILVDNEYATVIILDTEMDSIWGYTLNCYIENKTDKSVMFSADEASVNGFMIDPFWATQLAPGTRYYSGISFSQSDFEENGITDVESIEFILKAYDIEDWFGDGFVNEVITYTP